MNFIIVFLTLFLITLIGYVVISIFDLKNESDGISNISVAWGLGAGLVAFQLFTYSRLGIPWTRESILLFWIPFLFLFIYKKGFKTIRINFDWKSSAKEKIIFLLLFLSVIYTFMESIIRPLTTWDSWATWLFESKVFFIEGKIVPQLFNEFNSDYPLVFKLLGSFIYIFLGKVDDTAVLLLSFAFYIFSGLALFAFINQKFGQKLAVLFTFLLLTNQIMIRQGGRLEAGQADLPLAFYMLVATIIMLVYFTEKKIKLLIVANIFLGILCLVKLDGIPYAVVAEFFLIYFILKNKLYSHMWTITLAIIPVLDWFVFRFVNGLYSSYLVSHPVEISLEKTLNAFWGTFKELINIRSWGLSWVLYGASFLIMKWKGQIELLFLNTLVITQFAVFLGLYIFTLGNAPDSSIQRLLVHIYPILFLYLSFQGKVVTQRFPKIL